MNNNPSVIGTGKWFILHILNNNIHREEDEDKYLTISLKILNNMKCHCSEHIKKYLEENNIYNEKNKKINNEYVGIRNYFWRFHNTVNNRLGKEIFTVEELSNYNLENINVSENMMAGIWDTLHTLSFNINTRDEKIMTIQAIRKIMLYTNNIMNIPEDINVNTDLKTLMWSLHNNYNINNLLNLIVREDYMNHYSNSSPTCKK